MAAALKSYIALFGAVCIGIALLHIAVGPSSIPGSVPVNATMDSEDRFYATSFLGFGAAHIWCARDLRARGGIMLAMQFVFFLGGIARLISWAAVGPPIPLFIGLGAIELAQPPLIWLAYRKAFPSAM